MTSKFLRENALNKMQFYRLTNQKYSETQGLYSNDKILRRSTKHNLSIEKLEKSPLKAKFNLPNINIAIPLQNHSLC